MASKYSVVQFTPDPIADERINIGVVVIGGAVVRARFLSDWGRVQRFSGHDVSELKHFAKTVCLAASSQEILPGISIERLSEGIIAGASESWINSIQFTPLRASLRDADALLNEIAVRFLSEPERRHREYRDRRIAASAAAVHIRDALRDRVGIEAEELLKKRHRLPGKLQAHKFDAVVANGVPYFAAQGISFEAPASVGLHREAEAVAWQVTDVKANDPALPIAIVALAPVEGMEDFEKSRQLYEESTSVYRQLGARVVDENSVGAWAGEVVATLPFV